MLPAYNSGCQASPGSYFHAQHPEFHHPKCSMHRKAEHRAPSSVGDRSLFASSLFIFSQLFQSECQVVKCNILFLVSKRLQFLKVACRFPLVNKSKHKAYPLSGFTRHHWILQVIWLEKGWASNLRQAKERTFESPGAEENLLSKKFLAWLHYLLSRIISALNNGQILNIYIFALS